MYRLFKCFQFCPKIPPRITFQPKSIIHSKRDLTPLDSLLLVMKEWLFTPSPFWLDSFSLLTQERVLQPLDLGGEARWQNGHHHRSQHRHWQRNSQGSGEERYCSDPSVLLRLSRLAPAVYFGPRSRWRSWPASHFHQLSHHTFLLPSPGVKRSVCGSRGVLSCNAWSRVCSFALGPLNWIRLNPNHVSHEHIRLARFNKPGVPRHMVDRQEEGRHMRDKKKKKEHLANGLRGRQRAGMTDKPSRGQRGHCLPSRVRQETKSDGRVQPTVHKHTHTLPCRVNNLKNSSGPPPPLIYN